jgi:hypothetical protein
MWYQNDANLRPFRDLEVRIKSLKEYGHYPEKLISNKPFNEESVDYLISENWSVEKDSVASSCNFPGTGNKIKLKEGIKDYERDIHFFHEMMHAWYGYNLADNTPGGSNNRAIIEYLARTKRANSELLKHSIISFGLPISIYDKVSFEAFKDKKYFSDLVLENPDLLNKTLMDEADCLTYKKILEKHIEEKTIWKKVRSYSEDIEWMRAFDFLIEKGIMSYERHNNYSLCSEKGGDIFGIEHRNSTIYFTNKEDASNWDKDFIPVKLSFD